MTDRDGGAPAVVGKVPICRYMENDWTLNRAGRPDRRVRPYFRDA